MSDELAGSPSADENGIGLIERLRMRGQELSRGRRLVVSIPGWEDLGDKRGLWARFTPLSRAMQQQFAWSPDAAGQEVDIVAPMMAEACEEILIGTKEERVPLADEVAKFDTDVDVPFGPLRFGPELGALLGVGGGDGASVVKRMLIRGGDDLPFYGVWGELLGWSSSVNMESVEVAAGE